MRIRTLRISKAALISSMTSCSKQTTITMKFKTMKRMKTKSRCLTETKTTIFLYPAANAIPRVSSHASHGRFQVLSSTTAPSHRPTWS